MPNRRPLTALFLAGLIALTGCSTGVEADPSPETGSAESDALEEMGLPPVDADAIPDVVAEVNGEEISKELFISTLEGQLLQAAMQGGGEVDQAELGLHVVDQLVSNLVLVQAAESSGFSASEAEIDTALEELGAQNGLPSLEEVIAAFEAQGVSEELIREDAAAQVKINAFLEQEVQADEPSEAELKEQYAELVELMVAQDPDGEAGEAPAFEEVRDLLAEQSTQEQMTAEISRILEELLDQAEVTIHL